MKFSLRDLFLVTVIVAVCVAWWLDHWRQAERYKRDVLIQLDSTGEIIQVSADHPNPPLRKSQAPVPNPPEE